MKEKLPEGGTVIAYIDLHCDTLTKIIKEDAPLSLEELPGFHVDLKRLREAGTMAQVFAIWMGEEKDRDSDRKYIERLVSIFRDSLSDQVRHVQSVSDLENNADDGILSVILSLEDCRIVESVDDMEWLYSKGVRIFGLIWNYINSLGFPNSTDRDVMQRGLTPLGKEAVEYLNFKGGLIDVSHLSDGGFWDVKQISKKPFVATHSNARSITDHPRNLTDEMIRALAESGGVAGLNFCLSFLGEDRERNHLEDHLRHLNHLKKVGGEDIVAIGSDFDGVGGKLVIDEPGKMVLLFEALEKDGWSQRQIEKLAYGNILRVLREVW